MYKNTDKSTYMETNAKCKLVIDYPRGIVQRLKEFDITLDGEKISFNKKGGKLEIMIDKGEHIIELFQPLYNDEAFRFTITNDFSIQINLKFDPRKSWITLISLSGLVISALILGLNNWKSMIPLLIIIIPSLIINNTRFLLNKHQKPIVVSQ